MLRVVAYPVIRASVHLEPRDALVLRGCRRPGRIVLYVTAMTSTAALALVAARERWSVWAVWSAILLLLLGLYVLGSRYLPTPDALTHGTGRVDTKERSVDFSFDGSGATIRDGATRRRAYVEFRRIVDLPTRFVFYGRDGVVDLLPKRALGDAEVIQLRRWFERVPAFEPGVTEL